MHGYHIFRHGVSKHSVYCRKNINDQITEVSHIRLKIID